ncbi:MAG: VUT family protein, partial [Deltaproteobacteria bacterium]|nr:VUT family protein [Deltaproteobacteria bacterium]
TGSTAISQIADTVVVNFAALAGTMAFSEIAAVTAWSYVYKMAVAVSLTPLLYLVHSLVTNRLGIAAHPVED